MASAVNVLFSSSPRQSVQPSVVCGTDWYTVQPAQYSRMPWHTAKSRMHSVYIKLDPCGRFPSEHTMTTKLASAPPPRPGRPTGC